MIISWTRTTIIFPFFTHLTHKWLSHSWLLEILCENSLNVNNNNRVWKTSSSSRVVSSIFFLLHVRFQVFQLHNFKIHSTIMWSLQEGPRERVQAFRAFPTKPWNVEVFHSLLSLACNKRAWGRAKAVPFVCPFRSSNHGRPIVIYQSFCLWCFPCRASFQPEPQKENNKQQQIIIPARNFNYNPSRGEDATRESEIKQITCSN